MYQRKVPQKGCSNAYRFSRALFRPCVAAFRCSGDELGTETRTSNGKVLESRHQF